ncbi:hypothetical protein CG740_37135 [Streptomyces sp. CB01201]|uniref:hypothetical protein n=1 Tax=Streptomyces sp. CB01201 TaxID=2020324 RepID=UPI000C273907|nr:hypothetical protein [Streptomyces sp. CB01201]PJM98111.1 hypothetical protein CG740_37135 [Streptomyces sp. CB01201]
MAERIVTCRYLKAFDTQCTAEAIDPDGEVLICVRHAAKVMRTVQAAEASLNRAFDRPSRHRSN